MFEISREVFDAALFREAGDFAGQAADFAFPFDEGDAAADFSGRAGCFQARCTAADDDDVDIARDFLLFIARRHRQPD